MEFKTEVNQRIFENSHQLDKIRRRLFGKWGKYLYYSDISKANQLTEFQIAFLTLFEERYENEIYPKIHDDIYDRFLYYFDEEEKEYIILLQGLTINNIESGEWTLLYENEDPYGPIVHLDFKNWELIFCTLSS